MKFTYISAALLAVASAVKIGSVTVVETPAILAQDAPSFVTDSALAQEGEFTPALAEEIIAEHPEFWRSFSFINKMQGYNNWLFSQTEPSLKKMAMLAQEGEFTPALAEEIIEEDPEFWAECFVWLFSLVCAQSESPIQLETTLATIEEDFTPALAEEIIEEDPEFWAECFVWLFSLVCAQSEPAFQEMAMLAQQGKLTPALADEIIAEHPEWGYGNWNPFSKWW